MIVIRSRLVPALLLAASVLAACGFPGRTGTGVESSGEATSAAATGTAATGTATTGTTPGTATKLVVSVTDGTGGPPRTWTLTCDPPAGDHPDPEAACRALDAARAPFAPVPAGMACTQVYGGPETATIEGVWRGEPVRSSYARNDGCEIARWKAVAAVLGSGGST